MVLPRGLTVTGKENMKGGKNGRKEQEKKKAQQMKT
jgi:hypothetical protein